MTGPSIVSPLAAGRVGPRLPPAGKRLRVLLVEDDEGDAFLVSELLAESNAPVDLRTARSLAQAREMIGGVDCVLLDLGLPDAQGIEGLRSVLALASRVAVCVLTGLEDEHLGIAAVAEGAQDYLVKGSVDGVGLTRSLRYAVERKRADENALRLREAELYQAESSRLERGLLPKPLLSTDAVAVHPFYRPGRQRALLGGDFFDVVQTGPGRLELMVGDVCGHGVDEAALGVELRVAWRALVLAGVRDQGLLYGVEQVLVTERRAEEIFATVAGLTVDLERNEATLRLAGHPQPVLLSRGAARPMPARYGIVLGVRPGRPQPVLTHPLDAEDWSVLMYTDGLVEGRSGRGEERLDVDGLCRILAEPAAAEVPLAELPAWLVGRVEQINGGPLADDVAILLVSRGSGR